MAEREEHLLLLQRTRIHFPEPKSGSSQQLAAPVPGDSSDLHRHLTTCDIHTHTHKINKYIIETHLGRGIVN